MFPEFASPAVASQPLRLSSIFNIFSVLHQEQGLSGYNLREPPQNLVYDSSLFSVGKSEYREIIWNSGIACLAVASHPLHQEKNPTRKFAAESNLMLCNGGSMEAEQSVENAK